MAAKSKKPLYEMNPEELKELLRPVTGDVLQKKWKKNGYITYFDEELCESPDIMVHEYKDHRELVRIDDNGKATLVKKPDHEHSINPQLYFIAGPTQILNNIVENNDDKVYPGNGKQHESNCLQQLEMKALR